MRLNGLTERRRIGVPMFPLQRYSVRQRSVNQARFSGGLKSWAVPLLLFTSWVAQAQEAPPRMPRADEPKPVKKKEEKPVTTYAGRYGHLERTLQHANKVLTALKKNRAMPEVKKDERRQKRLEGYITRLDKAKTAVEALQKKKPNGTEMTNALNTLTKAMMPHEMDIPKGERWHNNIVRLAASTQEQTAGFHKYADRFIAAYKKKGVHTLQQAIVELQQQNQGRNFQKATSVRGIASMLSTYFSRFRLFAGSSKPSYQDMLSSSNISKLGSVWNTKDNAKMKGKRRFLLVYYNDDPFIPETKQILSGMIDTYQLDTGKKSKKDLMKIITERGSINTGEVMLLCPDAIDGLSTEWQLGDAIYDLEQFAKKTKGAQAFVWITAHGSKKAPAKSIKELAPLQGVARGVTHFPDPWDPIGLSTFDIPEDFWAQMSRDLGKAFKTPVPWIMDTCHSGANLVKREAPLPPSLQEKANHKHATWLAQAPTRKPLAGLFRR